MAPEPIRVDVGECRCAGIPHADGDAVFLKPAVDIQLGVAAWQEIRRHRANQAAALQGRLSLIYLQLGITDWTFLDAKGEPEPINAESIERLLPLWAGGMTVTDKADELYSPEIFRPLVALAATRPSSPAGPMAPMTLATPSPGPTLPEPSAPSSPPATAAGKRSGARGR